jgi:hypothetical protein
MQPGFVRKNAFALGGLALLGVGALAFLYFAKLTMRSQMGPEHVFELAERPKFLTETLAIEKAKEALKQDGMDPGEWHPVKNGRTRAPDGRIDDYMARAEGNPNRGVLLFTGKGRSMQFVAVELQGSHVFCQNSPGP